jgi:AraC-like DNA-binding protein/mannose-6-phosphate isomerase-like protein (cupin superfamily)
MNEYNELPNGNFCLFRGNSEKSKSPAIEIIDYEEGVSANLTTENTMLFFVMEGAISATYGFAENRLIEANHFFLIPPLASYNFSFTKNTKLYCCHLTEEIYLCRKDKSELLSEVCERMKLVAQDSDLFVVEANRNIINVLNSSSANIRLGLEWPDYRKAIIRELQILISAYYSDEDLARLFHPVFKKHTVFKSIVLQNRNKLSTVEEFAAAVHLNRNSFRNRFTEIFGINPSDWIINNRAEQVINELKKDTPIVNIVHSCGFSSYPNFVRFCKNFLQNTPAALRKQIKSTENPDVHEFLRRK